MTDAMLRTISSTFCEMLKNVSQPVLIVEICFMIADIFYLSKMHEWNKNM